MSNRTLVDEEAPSSSDDEDYFLPKEALSDEEEDDEEDNEVQKEPSVCKSSKNKRFLLYFQLCGSYSQFFNKVFSSF